MPLKRRDGPAPQLLGKGPAPGSAAATPSQVSKSHLPVTRTETEGPEGPKRRRDPQLEWKMSWVLFPRLTHLAGTWGSWGKE